MRSEAANAARGQCREAKRAERAPGVRGHEKADMCRFSGAC
jgi:hypothetical protein